MKLSTATKVSWPLMTVTIMMTMMVMLTERQRAAGAASKTPTTGNVTATKSLSSLGAVVNATNATRSRWGAPVSSVIIGYRTRGQVTSFPSSLSRWGWVRSVIGVHGFWVFDWIICATYLSSFLNICRDSQHFGNNKFFLRRNTIT